MLTHYRQLIVAATGCSAQEAAEIEDVMRNVVFCSTLDWQAREEFVNGARLAQSVLRHLRTHGRTAEAP
jgi:hypothetical protein